MLQIPALNAKTVDPVDNAPEFHHDTAARPKMRLKRAFFEPISF